MRDPGKAADAYLEAWTLLQSDEASVSVASLLFSSPVRLHPRQKEVIYLERTPDAAKKGEALYASLSFLVDTEGRVKDIEILSKNVPNEPLRSLRREALGTLYRPRIVAGEIVATEGLVLHQKYRTLVQNEAPVLEKTIPEKTMPETSPPEESRQEGSTEETGL